MDDRSVPSLADSRTRESGRVGDPCFPFRLTATGAPDAARDDAPHLLRAIAQGRVPDPARVAQLFAALADADEHHVAAAARCIDGHHLHVSRDGFAQLWDTIHAAIDAADAEGALWTPRLEALSHATAGPLRRRSPDAHQSGQPQKELVASWLAEGEGSDDPAAVRRLYDAFPSLRELIFRHARGLDASFVPLVNTPTARGRYATALLENSALADDTIVAFAAYGVPNVVDGQRLDWTVYEPARRFLIRHQARLATLAPECFQQVLDWAMTQARAHGEPPEFVFELTATPRGMWEPFLEHLLAHLATRRAGEMLITYNRIMGHPSTPPAVWAEIWRRVVADRTEAGFLWNLGNHDDLAVTPEWVTFLETIVPPQLETEAVNCLVRLHGLPERLLADVLAHGTGKQMRTHLVQSPWALQFPIAGHFLLGSDDLQFLGTIATTAAVPLWVRYRALQRLLEKSPRGGLDWVAGLDATGKLRRLYPDGIPTECLAPLLGAKKPQATRERALEALTGPWFRPDVTIPPAPPKPRRAARLTPRPSATDGSDAARDGALRDAGHAAAVQRAQRPTRRRR